MRNNLLIFLLGTLLWNCEQKVQDVYENDEGYLIYDYYYPNGKLKERYSFKVIGKDTIQEGPYLSYYENGQLKDSTPYQEGKVHRTEINYYENGQVERIGYLEKGQRIDTLKHFYSNGLLKEVSFYIKGKSNGVYQKYYVNGVLKLNGKSKNGYVTGAAYEYDSLGQLLTFLYYDSSNYECIYRADYTEEGVFEKDEGQMMVDFAIDEKGELNVGESLEVKVKLAQPPKLSVEAYLGIYDEENKDISNRTLPIDTLANDWLLYKLPIKKKGYYKYALGTIRTNEVTGEKTAKINRGYDWAVNVW